MVKGRETRDKKIEVRAVLILDAKVVNDYSKLPRISKLKISK